MTIAITKGKIADILAARGELDEALRIRREDQLPVYERLGEVREIAITKGKIADILFAQHQTLEAIEIYREQVLPVYAQLGDQRMLMVAQANLAWMLLQSDTDPSDEPKALLCSALKLAQAMQLPEAQQITKFLQRFGLRCE